uniref:Uncharacterized protein n=1 Tax=Anguilla anguilla TaxID=7936 RepID=A0A0E9TUP4_ANGAN
MLTLAFPRVTEETKTVTTATDQTSI